MKRRLFIQINGIAVAAAVGLSACNDDTAAPGGTTQPSGGGGGGGEPGKKLALGERLKEPFARLFRVTVARHERGMAPKDWATCLIRRPRTQRPTGSPRSSP